MSQESYKPSSKKHESYEPTHESKKHQHEVEKLRHERAERADHSPEKAATEARQSVQHEAISGAETHRPHSETRQTDQIRTKDDRIHSFNTTMSHVRQKLSKREKGFSKLIHQPTVEKVSDIAGKTLARPSGIVGGTIAAFIGLLSVYGVAKFAGFPLSGSEMPLFLAIGFLLGLVVEVIYKAVRSIFTRSTS